jgi:hypothetical protein
MAFALITYFLYVFILISLCYIHNSCVLSPFLHDIYYQQYYEDLKCECLTVVLNSAVLILMMGRSFVFAGVEATPQDIFLIESISLREFLYIMNSVL